MNGQPKDGKFILVTLPIISLKKWKDRKRVFFFQGYLWLSPKSDLP